MRTAEVTRNTKETQIRVKLNLDGKGAAKLSTGLPFLDHMLDQVARHGMLDLEIEAKGDLHIDGHHTVEDIGITLGQAFAKAIGDKAGVRRFGHAYVPLDEAYHVFAGKSLMPRLPEFGNLIIIRTVSKLGLAGIRLGYLVGRPEWVQQFDKVRPPYNVNVLTQAAALFLLERLDVLEDQAARIKADRTGLGKSLAALKGVTVFPSEANFFLIRVPDAEQTFRALKEQNVLIKNLHPGLRNCLRVTVGTPDENRILLTALREAI